MVQTECPSILIVEDNAADLAVLVEAMQHRGFRIIVAQCGEECLRRAAAVQPDLILLDILLPGIDGLEVCRRLKAQPGTSDIAVIFLTALADTAQKLAGFEAGGIDYIAKPFHVEEVLARVGTHVKLSTLQKQLAVRNEELQVYRDSLERRVADQTERLHLLSFALNHVRQAVYLIDEQACCHYVNQQACRQLGFSEDELIKMTVMDVARSWTMERWARAWQRLRQLGADAIEDVHRRQNGEEFPVEVEASYLEFEGKAYAFMIVRDITARKAAERAIHASEQRFRTLAENFPDLVARFDRDCRFVYGNPAFLGFRGATGGVSSKRPCDLDPNAQQGERTMASIRQVFATGIADRLESRWWTVAGNEHIFEVRHIPEKDNLGSVVSVLGIARDITELRTAEQALHRSEREFRTLAENSPDNIVRYDRYCRVLYANARNRETIKGISAVEPVGKTPHEAFLTDQVRDYQARIERVIETGQDAEVEITLPDTGAGKRYHEIRIVAERDADGEIVGALAMGRDITERRMAALRLHASEQAFRAVVENTPDGIVRYDRNCRRVYGNPAMLKLTGRPAAEFLGKTPAEDESLAPTLHLMDLLQRVIASGEAASRETLFRNPDGEMRWAHVRLVPEFDPDGLVASVLMIARDVHDLKESEQRFRTLAENFPDRLARFDREGLLTYVNPAITTAQGNTAEDIIGKSLRDLIPDTEQVRKLDELVRRAFAEGLPNECEALWPVAGGEEHTFEVRHVPERDGAGNVVSVLGISRDITQLRAAEEALRRSEREFRTLAENAPVNIARYDRFCRLRYANAQLESTLGVAAERMLGKTPREKVPDGPYADYQACMESVIETGQEAVVELTLPDAGAGERYHEIRFVAERGPGGEIVGALALGTDVTERTLAERKLQAREQTFRTVVENSPDGIIRYDREFRRLYANPAMLKLFGHPEEDLLGKAPGEISLIPDSQPVIKQMRQVFETGVDLTEELLYRNALGEPRWAQIHLVPEFDAPGKVSTVLLVARDIHVIKDSEQRFRTLAENFPDIVGRFDADGRVIYTNSSALRILQVPIDSILGRTMDEIDPCKANTEAHTAATDLIVRTFREGLASSHDAPYQVRGDQRIFEIRLVPESDVSGRVASVLGIARDVTLRKRYEIGLLERAQLEQRMSAYFANAPGHFWTLIHLPDGRYVMPFGSPAIRELYGVEPTDVPFNSVDLVKFIHPEDLDRHRRAVEEAERDLTQFHCEYRILHPQKGLRWIEGRALPQRQADGSTVWHGFMNDITERIASEETIRKLNADLSATLQAIPDLLLEVDRSGTYQGVWARDPAMQERQRERLIGRTVVQALPPEAATNAMAALREADKTGYSFGKVLRFDDDEGPRWFELSVSKKSAPDDADARFLVLRRDVTWRVQQQQRETMRMRIFRKIAEGRELAAVFALAVQYVERACPRFKCGVMLPDADTRHLRTAVAPGLPSDLVKAIDGMGIEATPDIRTEDAGLLVPIVDSADGILGAVLVHSDMAQQLAPADLQLVREACRLIGIAIERRRMEEALAAREREFRTLAENSPYAIVRYDTQCRQTYVNAEFERINKLSRAEAVGKRPAELWPGLAPLAKAFTKELRATMTTGIANDLDLTNTTSKTWWNVRIVPEYNSHGALIGALTIWVDITQRKDVERRLRQSYDLLQRLTMRRETAREEERKRIARELHDELGQHLTALRMGVSTLRVQFGHDNPLLRERVQNLIALTDKTIQVVRNVAAALRPAVLDAGIGPAVEWLAAEFTRRSGTPCSVAIPDEPIAISEQQGMALFRVVQESLTNIARHADAQNAEVSLFHDDAAYITEVHDDGKGFDPTALRKQSFGLVGMRERIVMLGGDISVESTPGNGTTVRVRIPHETKRGEA